MLRSEQVLGSHHCHQHGRRLSVAPLDGELGRPAPRAKGSVANLTKGAHGFLGGTGRSVRWDTPATVLDAQDAQRRRLRHEEAAPDHRTDRPMGDSKPITTKTGAPLAVASPCCDGAEPQGRRDCGRDPVVERDRLRASRRRPGTARQQGRNGGGFLGERPRRKMSAAYLWCSEGRFPASIPLGERFKQGLKVCERYQSGDRLDGRH